MCKPGPESAGIYPRQRFKKYGAVRLKNGKYAIVGRLLGLRRTSTWNIREQLKSLGGHWNPQTKQWEDIEESQLEEIDASKQIKVLVDKHCHMPEDYAFVYEDEIVDGRVPVSCPMCDTGFLSGMRAKILKIVGEK